MNRSSGGGQYARFAVARRLGWLWPAALLTGAIDAALGAVIIVLKALLHWYSIFVCQRPRCDDTAGG